MPEDEAGDDALGPADRALNSVRGQAVGSLVASVGWWRKLDGTEQDSPLEACDSPIDADGLAQALDHFVTRDVEPFYLDQATNDGQRLAELRHTLFGALAPETIPLEDRITFAELRAAMPFDAMVFRAFWRVMGMLAKPDDVYTDRDVVAHTQDVLRSLDTAPTMTQPTRAELEAALA